MYVYEYSYKYMCADICIYMCVVSTTKIVAAARLAAHRCRHILALNAPNRAGVAVLPRCAFLSLVLTRCHARTRRGCHI